MGPAHERADVAVAALDGAVGTLDNRGLSGGGGWHYALPMDWIRTLPVWSQGFVALAIILAAGGAFMFALYLAFSLIT